MSSINSVFQPLTPTYTVDSSAAVQIKEAGQVGATVFRIRALTASGYIAWGAKAGFTAVAPTLATPSPQTIGVSLGETVYLELPPNSFFIGDKVLATSGFEVTGGQGGASCG